MQSHKHFNTTAISHWVLLPLRLFLGITFAYAGIQKLTDPQFFQPSAPGYIGKQMTAFATTSPLHSLLLTYAIPHATGYGLAIAYGELAIGVGVLVGLLLRPAAFFGLILSILFFLTATWRVYPYFYGSDIVFSFCWLTLLLNGALNTGWPTLDEYLTRLLLQRTSPARQSRLAYQLHTLLGSVPLATPSIQNISSQQSQATSGAVHYVRGQRIQPEPTSSSRRSFLVGTLAGSTGTFALVAIAYVLRVLGGASDTDTAVVRISVPPADMPVPAAPANTITPATPGVIARVSAIPQNSAASFTLPTSGDPGILVHLSNDQFVAYDALCTHAGCQVDYDPDSHLLVCPCHGAAFDPSNKAAVVQPPANLPLEAISIQVDSATGAIMLK